MTSLSPEATLAQVRAWLKVRSREGTTCPACDQHVKVYRRKLNSGMAVSLISMYRAAKLEYQHIPTTIGGRSREEGKLAYWGLVDEEAVKRPDGGRAGYWRVTEPGERFVLGKIAVPKYALVYNGERLRLDGEPVSIQDVLGEKFNYAELMAA